MSYAKKKTEDNTNYSFALKCLAAVTATALIAAGAIALVAASKGTAVAAAAVTGKALAATAVATSAAATASVALPVVGALLLLGGICLLPYLLCRRACSSPYVRTTPADGGWWGRSGFWGPTYYPTPAFGGGFNGRHHHGHPVAPIGGGVNPFGRGPIDGHHHGHAAAVGPVNPFGRGGFSGGVHQHGHAPTMFGGGMGARHGGAPTHGGGDGHTHGHGGPRR